jgi:hypothetical protein
MTIKDGHDAITGAAERDQALKEMLQVQARHRQEMEQEPRLQEVINRLHGAGEHIEADLNDIQAEMAMEDNQNTRNNHDTRNTQDTQKTQGNQSNQTQGRQ